MEQGSNGKEIANQTGLDISQVRKVVSHVVEKIFEAGGVQGSFRSPAVLDFSEVRHGVPERVIEESVLAQKLDSSTPAVLRTEGAFAGRYKIERVIGKGGMGVVYKARHLLMERTVAIKVLYPESASDLKAVAQFKKESQAASALKHHNIVSVYDFGVTEAGQPFLVMDYINGVSLDKLFQEKEHIEPLRHVDMFLQVCDGLAVTHTHGLVHCDLKPSNIMVEKDATGKDSIKIVDFGLAKVMPVSASVQARLTDAFEITGSPLYMSPEHCKGNTLDARSDIYSLGCIMYEAFTGKPVFDGASPYKVFSQHLIDDPLAFAVVQSGRQLPPEMETIVLKALKKNPDERYQSALELKHDLIQLKARLTNGAVVAL
jgi:serine/threonine-protein kinase